MRDSGVIRSVMDSLVWFGVPTLLKKYPWALVDFLKLNGWDGDGDGGILYRLASNWGAGTTTTITTPDHPGLRHDLQLRTKRISYGPDPRQYVHLITRDSSDAPASPSPSLQEDQSITIVHGGAWGSGQPELYLLAATPFLNAGYAQVAIVGYRTYPTADVQGQVDDIASALRVIPATPRITVMGHSSGCHVLCLAFLQERLPNNIEAYIGLSGVYDIPAHYHWEIARGVERISPMAPACGMTLGQWKQLSPTRIARQEASNDTSPLSKRFPPSTLLLHGCDDVTVPYTSTKEFAEATGLRWMPLSKAVGHVETISDLMFGGPTREVVLDWLTVRM
jgi:acetyl esterase/lipase